MEEANGLLVPATTGIGAPSIGQGLDARAVGTEAPKLGSGEGMTAVGTGLGQRVAAVPPAGATTCANTSHAGPECRNCTRQVAHVVRYLSATYRHNAR